MFLDFQAKHTSLTVWEMFKGFRGYVQADAHAIYDALSRGLPPEGAAEKPGRCGPPPLEVGCFRHPAQVLGGRRPRAPAGVDGVRRIDAIFDAERALAELAPAQRKLPRDAEVRPVLDLFIPWAEGETTKIEGRGLVATALDHSRRHEAGPAWSASRVMSFSSGRAARPRAERAHRRRPSALIPESGPNAAAMTWPRSCSRLHDGCHPLDSNTVAAVVRPARPGS